MTKNFDQDAVRATYAKDPVARAILDFVANKRKSVNAISADSILDICTAAHVNATREMVIATMRELAEAGAGVFLCGRRGSVSRLRFALTSRIVGMVARGTHDIPAETVVMETHADVIPMARQEIAKAPESAGLDLASVRELLAGSSVEELRHVATYIGKMLELREMEAGNFDRMSVQFGRRASDRKGGARVGN